MPHGSTPISRFIDRLGHYFETWGSTRSAGQIFAFLLISEEPQSLDDIADALQISKGSASLGTRVWEQAGLIERVSVPGDRKTYYHLHPEVTERLAAAAISGYQQFVDILQEADRHIGDDRPRAKARLAAFMGIYRHLIENVPILVAEWSKQQAKE